MWIWEKDGVATVSRESDGSLRGMEWLEERKGDGSERLLWLAKEGRRQAGQRDWRI